MRVIGGEFYYEGHVEICMEGEWKTVTLCDQSWDDIDAEVTCSQLGYISPGTKRAISHTVTHINFIYVHRFCSTAVQLLFHCITKYIHGRAGM